MDGYPSVPPYSPTPSSPIVTLPKEILAMIFDPSMVIERIRHDLKGETGPYLRYTEINGKQVPETFWLENGQRDMNDVGVEAVIGMLNKYVNRNTFFSNLDSQEVYKITKTIAHNLNAMFASKYGEYQIDINRMSLIKEGIVDMIFLALKQSESKALMNALTQLVNVSEVKDASPKPFTISDLSPFKGNK